MENYKCLNLDWLGFTFKCNVTDKLPLEQFWDMFPEFDKSLLTGVSFRTLYTDTLNYCGIYISYNTFGEDLTETQCERYWKMGVNIQIPSSMLSFFFDLLGVDYKATNSFPMLLTELYKRNCKPSRIDLCYDDFTKTYDVAYYDLKKALGLIQTPYTITTTGKRSKGLTIYFGSLKKRSKLLRIYDKDLQSNGLVDSVRYEFEFHNDDACGIADLILNEYQEGIPFVDMLLSFVKVKDANSVANCARIQDAKLDEDWISTLKDNLTLLCPIRIPKSNPLELQELNYYVEVQALSSIAGYYACYGSRALLALIRDAINSGRISARYQAHLNKLKACNELWEDDYINNPFF